MGQVCSIEDVLSPPTRPSDDVVIPPFRWSIEQNEAYNRGMADAYRNVLELLEQHDNRKSDGHIKSGHVPAEIRDRVDSWT